MDDVYSPEIESAESPPETIFQWAVFAASCIFDCIMLHSVTHPTRMELEQRITVQYGADLTDATFDAICRHITAQTGISLTASDDYDSEKQDRQSRQLLNNAATAHHLIRMTYVQLELVHQAAADVRLITPQEHTALVMVIDYHRRVAANAMRTLNRNAQITPEH